MPAAARNLTAATDPREWITLEDAAALLGEPLRTLQFRAKGIYSQSDKARIAPAPSGRGKPVWWIARSLDPRLSVAPDGQTRADLARESLLARYPAHYVERAYRKARWVNAWRQRLMTPRLSGQTDLDIAGVVVGQAREFEGPDFKISVRSLQVWHASMNELGEDGVVRGVEALIDRYGLGAPADGITSTRSAAAIEFFYDQFRTPLRLSLKYCHGLTLRQAKASGWSWPASYSATKAWHRDFDDRSLTFLLRHGKKEWSKRYMPYLEQDWELVRPGQMYVADHHQCDFFVTYKQGQIRPWLTAIQDCRSRRIVGWTLGPAPHQDAILSAMRMAFKQAVPEVMRLDNGRDFKSKAITGCTPKEEQDLKKQADELGCAWRDCLAKYQGAASCDDPRWTGIAEELGIDLIFALPYHAWAKGTVERFFRTLEDGVGRAMPTYCGNTSESKPESLQLIREGYTGLRIGKLAVSDTSDVPTMESARRAIEDWLEIYHHTQHNGRGVDGRTPMEVWQSHEGKRTVQDHALDMLLSVRGLYKVGPNGVSIQIGGRRFGFGARNASLRAWVGREVLVAHDPDTPTRALALDPKNRTLIAALEPNERIHPLAKIDDLREASAAINRERKIMQNAEKVAARRTRTATQRVNRDMQAQASELRATGTDGRSSDVVIRPVRTGFESVSIPAQTDFEVDMPNSDDLADFLNDAPTGELAIEDEGLRSMDVSDLLEVRTDDEDDPLSQLL